MYQNIGTYFWKTVSTSKNYFETAKNGSTHLDIIGDNGDGCLCLRIGTLITEKCSFLEQEKRVICHCLSDGRVFKLKTPTF
jgi:hypothetical protein